MCKSICTIYIIGLFTILSLNAGEDCRYIMVDGVYIKVHKSAALPSIIQPNSSSAPIVIPLKRVGNLFVIEAEIDQQAGNFILDLGAPYLVLNSTYFRDYRVDENFYAGTLFSETSYLRRTKVKRLTIQGIDYVDLNADITDLGMIENKRGIKILGLLGVSLFKNFVLELDVLNQQLILYSGRDQVKMDSRLLMKTPFFLRNDVIILKAKLKGSKLNLSLDTAAERNILDNNLSSEVYNGMKILRTSKVSDASGGNSEALVVVIDSIFVGDVKLKRMQTLIINLKTMSRAYGSDIDGMLGYPFFASGRIMIDFKNEQLMVLEFKLKE